MAEASEKRKSDFGLPFIQEVSFLRSLPSLLQKELCDHSDFLRFSEKEIIFQEGDNPVGGFIVATGYVVMMKKTFKKRDFVTELLGSHEPFGMVSAVHGEPYPLGAEVLRESVVFRIHQDYLAYLSRKEPEFVHSILALCRSRLMNSHKSIAHLADASSKVRIAHALLLAARAFCSHYGFSFDESAHIDVTRDEVSPIAGTTVETCIRVTRSFEDQGILEFPASKHILIVKPKMLSQICEI